MSKVLYQAPAGTKNTNKYTVEEVLKSLYWMGVDYDDDFDGQLHIISTINGAEVKIPFKDLAIFLATFRQENT